VVLRDDEASAGFEEGPHAIPIRMSWKEIGRTCTVQQTIDRQ
jgi:hypothetical protein